MLVTCENAGCGKIFNKRATEVAKTNHNFCERECYYEWKQTPENNPNFQGGPITVQCAYCGEEMKRDKNKVELSEEHFCDQRCHGLHRSLHQVGLCNPNFQGGPMTVQCAYCGKDVKRPKNQVEAYEEHFCSPYHQYLHKVGPKASNWCGGRTVTSDGYILVLVSGHPNASRDGYVMEHRLVVEESLGRTLTKTEIVHHINGFVHDNRPSNLRLFANSAAHLKWHAELKAIWLEITGGERILDMENTGAEMRAREQSKSF